MKVFVQGSGPVTLAQSDFVGAGGQANVWVKGGTAYKVYHDPAHAIAAAKVKALGAIADESVVKPRALLLDGRDQPIGYAMDAAQAPHSLCQLFVPAFRDRHRTPSNVASRLAALLRRHVAAVHRAGILVVDLNELNVLVASSFDRMYLIDVDSYECPGFPATALMPSVQDFQATKKVPGRPRPVYEATELTDWYSYAVLSFQLFVGCHPYKGSLKVPELAAVPKDERLEWRARRSLSAFRPEASVPACCYCFDSIPRHFRDWLEAVLDRGERLPPPDPSLATAMLPVPRAPFRDLHGSGDPSAGLHAEKIDERDGIVLAYSAGLFLARKDGAPTLWLSEGSGSKVQGSSSDLDPIPAGPRYPVPGSRSWSGAWMSELGTGQTLIGFTPKLNLPIAFRLSGNVLDVYQFETKQRATSLLHVDEMAMAGSRFLVRSESSVIELGFSELTTGTLVHYDRKVADVMPRASRLFEGCVVQSLLGSTFLSVFPKPKSGYQVRVAELDGAKVLDAKFMACRAGGVLMAIVAKNGIYERIVLRFDSSYESYDYRSVSGVEPSLVNFVVVESSGATAALVEEDRLEVFLGVKGHTACRTIESPLLGGDLRLCLVGDGIGFTRGGELWRLRLR